MTARWATVAAKERAVVVGGGLAGVSAAAELADRGWEVTLLEARRRLGGATYSFERHGRTVDTGQHVLLRCYDHHRRLLDRMGVGSAVDVQSRFSIPVLRPGARSAVFRRGRFGPAPAHLLPALARYTVLPVADRTAVARAVAALYTVDPDAPGTDLESFGGWLRRHGQRELAIDRLWALLCVAALNLRPEQASLALAARVFRTALLRDHRSADIAVPRVPLSALHDAPARRTLHRLGVRCCVGERVTAIDSHGGQLVVRTAAGEIDAAAVVLAVPHDGASRLVPERAAPDRDRWAGLGFSPIVNVHVWFDRRVATYPFAAALDSPVQWVFDRTAPTERGQYLVVSLSAADEQITRRADSLCREQVTALRALFPAARGAQVLDTCVTREPRATFRQQPGTAELRPRAHTRVPGLVLAGAWTGTGWPDTTEGAVRSGLTAARAVGPVHPARLDNAISIGEVSA